MSICRPNAPGKLPSDCVDWSSRRSDSILPSSLPRTDQSPLPSPKSPLSRLKSSRPSPGQRGFSDGGLHYFRSRQQLRQNASPDLQRCSLTPDPLSPGIGSHVSSDSLRSRLSNGSSSVASKARNMLRRKKQETSYSDDLPKREARAGLEWRLTSAGSWVEVWIDDPWPCSDSTSKFPTPLPLEPSVKPDHVPFAEHLEKLQSAPVEIDSSPLNAHEQAIGNIPVVKVESAPPSPRHVSTVQGILHRTKNRLTRRKAKLTDEDTTFDTKSRTATGEALERATSALLMLSQRVESDLSRTTSHSNLSVASPEKAHRHTSHLDEAESKTSSIRSLLMGRVPDPSPEEAAMYTGSDNQRYITVDITDPTAPTFLPSEAKRVNTPPAAKRGQGGFFFDMNAHIDAEPFTERPHNEDEALLASAPSRASDTRWYDAELKAIDAGLRAGLLREEFVTDLPDHLPNSILCPKHPKHPSGGLGFCPMHGRPELNDQGQIAPWQLAKRGIDNTFSSFEY